MNYFKKFLMLFKVLSLLILISIDSSEIDFSSNIINIYDDHLISLEQACLLFPQTVSEIELKKQLSINSALKDLEIITKILPENRTFNNSIKAYDVAEERFNIILHSLNVLRLLHPSNEIRSAVQNSLIEMKSFYIDAFTNKHIYNVFREYEENRYKIENLNEEENYYFQQKLKLFNHEGLNLQEDKLKEIQILKKEITNLELEFQKNINNDKTFIKVDEDSLVGCDELFLKKLDKDSSQYYLKCDYSTANEVLNHCDNEKTRKEFFIAFNNRAYPANKEVFEKLIAKRDEFAKKLGFISYADFDLNDQMAQSTEIVYNFISDLQEKISRKTIDEFEDLKRYFSNEIFIKNNKIEQWNYNYLKTNYKQKRFQVNDREIDNYFPLENTIDKMLLIFQKFLNLEFKKVQLNNLWDEDIFAIEIYKKNDQNAFAYVFLDLFPRENKYPSACTIKIISALKCVDNKQQIPSVHFLIANFPKSINNHPSLLKLRDVQTLFHEFGHVMHAIFGQTELAGFSGTSVKSDFVEVPSMLFQEWLNDIEILQLISSHYITGKSIPENLINSIIELNKIEKRDFILLQGVLALTSLEYFDRRSRKDFDEIIQYYWNKYIPCVQFDSAIHYYASWSHLANYRYAAKYYSYLWSEVLAIDIFTTIKKNGLLNPEIGQKLIDTILSKGGSKDPNILLKDFLDREIDNKSIFKYIGVN